MSREPLTQALRDIVADLLRDARCTYRDARRFPNSAEALLPYADRCRQDARRIRNGAAVRLDRYGWPVFDPAPGDAT